MRISLVFALVLSLLVLSGCSGAPGIISKSTNPAPSPVSGPAIHGIVHGGQSSISGSHVYLYAVGDTGYGGAAVSLLNSGVLTQTPAGGQDGSGNYYVTSGSDGSFNITGEYTCPTSGAYPEVYVLAMGGNPTGSGSVNNTAISLVAPIGDCSKSGFGSKYVVVNEVSTIGTVYAASLVITDIAHVSAPPPSDALAFTALGNIDTDLLYASNTGVARATTPAGNGTPPQAEVNTLANILAACVNTTSSSSSNCQTLFANAKNGASTPSETFTAALNIARNPGANIANLFGLQSGNADFVPDLSSAPNDFTIAITYTGGGLDGPVDLAIDGSGDVWVSNEYATSISELASDGTVLSPSAGFTGGGLSGGIANEVFPGIAVDTAGNVWDANPSSTLSKFSSTGTAISGSGGYTGGGIDIPDFLAVDTSNNIWLGNRGDFSLSEFNSSGTPISGSGGYTGGGLAAPSGVAFDISGDLWAANNGVSGSPGGDSLTEVNSTGTPISGSPFTGGGLVNPFALAIGPSGNIWVLDTDPSPALSAFNSSGTAISGSPFTGGGLDEPRLFAIDASGNVFVPNIDGNSLSVLNSSGTAITSASGYTGWLPPSGGSTLNTPTAAAIDGNGNVWVTDGAMINGNYAVTEFVGLATPVVTPIVANLLPPYSSSAVNKP